MDKTGVCFQVSILLWLIFAGYSISQAAVIPVTRFNSPELRDGAPIGWALEKKAGAPSLKLEKDGEKYYLHLMSHGDSSFGVRTSAQVNVKDVPVLSWRWRVDKLPAGGDVRKQSMDDQALQIYIAFKETGFPAVLNTPIVGYIWDNEAPKGWSGRSTQIGGDKMRYIVLRNKTDKTGQWYTERRNIYEDYKKLFGDINGGEPLGVTTGVQVHINSQRTKTPAQGMIGDMYFSSETTDVAVTQAAKEKIIARPVVISAPKRTQAPDVSAGKNASRQVCLNISMEFETNSTQVLPVTQGQIQTLMEYLATYPQDRLTITGHTDNIGSEANNRELSTKRAESVKKYLVEKLNIDENRMIVLGVGSSQPIADNSKPEGQARNRRVTIQDCPE